MVSFHTIFPSEVASLSSSHGSALRKRGFRALRSATKDAVFGNCKPFEKGLTENLTSAASGRKSTTDNVELCRGCKKNFICRFLSGCNICRYSSPVP